MSLPLFGEEGKELQPTFQPDKGQTTANSVNTPSCVSECECVCVRVYCTLCRQAKQAVIYIQLKEWVVCFLTRSLRVRDQEGAQSLNSPRIWSRSLDIHDRRPEFRFSTSRSLCHCVFSHFYHKPSLEAY